MNIRQTMQALDELADEPRENVYDALDDLGTAEHLLLTCEPALAPAAMQRLMQRFMFRCGLPLEDHRNCTVAA